METFGNFPLVKVPCEMWDMIFFQYFDFLKDRHSLASCVQACSAWNSFLHSRKQVLLFHQVLPHIVPYLDSSSFWKCRLVSKSWKADIDTFLENPEDRRDQHHKIPKFCVKFHEPEQVFATANALRAHPSNPFPGRSISIRMDLLIKPAINSILESFGQHVWYLHLVIFDKSTMFAQILEECLGQTPNLKGLYIEGCILPYRVLNFCYSPFPMEFEAGTELVHFLHFETFPHLEKLEILDVRISNDLPKLIARSLLTKIIRLSDHAGQLKRLHLEVGDIANVSDLLPVCENMSELGLVINKWPCGRLHYANIFKSPIKKLVVYVPQEVETVTDLIDFNTKIRNCLLETLETFYVKRT